MADATVIPIRPAGAPGYTDTVALNDIHALLTTGSDDDAGLLSDVAAILTRTGRAMIAYRDIEVAAAESATGRPVALVRSAGTVITIGQDQAGSGLLVLIAPADADRDRITVTLSGDRLTPA